MAKGKKKTTVHKSTPNADRPNGKSWKKHPKAFDRGSGRLFTSLHYDKGTTV